MNIPKLYELLEQIIKELEYQHPTDNECELMFDILEKVFKE